MNRYSESEKMLERAQLTVPLGSQTFSKSRSQFPYGVSPYFIEKGQGSKVWDADGNEYIDFINSLAAITLGYNDLEVTEAVSKQLKNGVTFSLPHRLEMEVAERLVDMVPCAEMVRFGKNGSDATAGAIRLARAFTGRDHVAVCGYHGWQDWYIGSTARNLGVPQATRDLTHSFTYNDLDSLQTLFDTYPGQFAAVIMEPMNIIEPEPGFLLRVKELAHLEGALLIFDEMVTGFRYSPGGAQELFNVTPDLTALGKGLANGYPLSAVVGRRDVMSLMEEVFFSFTFGGETLSLAAAAATLDKIREQPVTQHLARQGTKVREGVQTLIDQHRMGNIISIGGHPSWSIMTVQDTDSYSMWQIKSLFLQELFARGILAIGSHNMSYSHCDEDVDRLLSVYDEVFPIMRNAIDNGSLENILQCEPLQPLFRVR